MAIVSFRLLSFLCCLFVKITPQVIIVRNCDNTKGNYTTNSTYHNNLNALLSNFSSHTEINYGFYNFSYGGDPNKVYAIGLCRGDRKKDDCLQCLKISRKNLTQECPNQKEAIRWGPYCMLRYSYRSIFDLMETQPSSGNVKNETPSVMGPVDQFNAMLKGLMENLTRAAASGDSRLKYAAGDTHDILNSQTIFGLTQCTPDLTSKDCTACLDDAISVIPQNGKTGGEVVNPSCRIRFENYVFYDSTIQLSSSSTNNTSSSRGRSNTSRTIIIIALVVLFAIVVLVSLFCLYLRGRKPRNFSENEVKGEGSHEDGEITFAESLQFNFDTIQVATNEFADSNKVGQGGFGAVYRGHLSNGQEIAVKRLSQDSGQGDMEFKNEVLLVAKLQHRNLVRLLGFCLEGRERLLVYEFVPNKSLDYFIFDPTKKTQLDWQKRNKIIRGVARGLLYLHEDSRFRIIHRDLKASNILLDEDMHPKISDFGMARLVCVDQTQENTNKIVGTYGYMAPKYAIYGEFSVKSDVFSFGVLVLEIVSGQKNSGIRHGENAEHLLSFAWRNWKGGRITNIIDPTLNNGPQDEIMRCIHIGLLCVQENVNARPTMASVVLMLNCYSLTLSVPSEPAFLMVSRTGSLQDMMQSSRSSESANKSTQNSINEASITELYPR